MGCAGGEGSYSFVAIRMTPASRYSTAGAMPGRWALPDGEAPRERQQRCPSGADYQIANHHPVIGVDSPSGRDRFRMQSAARPDLVDAKQGRIVRARVAPSAPGLAKAVVKPWTQRGQGSIASRGVEVSAHDHVS